MVTLLDLWLPILVSTVAVFILSFVMWMVLPHHKGDFTPLPDEDENLSSIAAAKLPPGQYTFPFCHDNAQMRDPAFIKRWEDGPSGFLTIRPTGPMSMGKNMTISTLYNLVITVVVAYLATMALPVAAPDMSVFRFVAVAAWLGCAGALGWGPIWFSKSWGATTREILDGLVYGLATGAIFMAFWPAA